MRVAVAAFLFFYNFAFASTVIKDTFGRNVRWSPFVKVVPFRVVPSNNNPDFTDTSDVSSLVKSGMAHWNGHGGPTLTFSGNFSSTVSGGNDISFSTSVVTFPSNGVLAITQNAYDQDTARLIESNIILNDNITFTNDPTSTNDGDSTTVYLGDILTHELGHSLGLSHSLTSESSMIFTAFEGQVTTEDSDKAGISTLYGGSGNSLSGKIVGGTNQNNVPIFGSLVQAVSLNTGKVAGDAISDGSGNFSISGLDSDDTYYLYIKPVNNSASIPNFYLTAQSNFCTSGNYRGDFVSQCGTGNRGYPHGFSLRDGSKSVGSLSIGCDIKNPIDYLSSKGGTFNLDVDDGGTSYGNAFSGSFTQTETQANTPDTVTLDLTGLAIPNANYKVEIKITTQSLFSEAAIIMNVSNGLVATDFPTTLAAAQDGVNWLVNDSDGASELDIVARFDLDTTTANNFLTLTLTPFDLPTQLTSYRADDFLASSNILKDNLLFYFMTVRIVEEVSGEFVQVYEKEYEDFLGNSSCVEGPRAFSSRGFASNQDDPFDSSSSLDDEGTACGTVNLEDPPSSGPMAFTFGLILSTLLTFFVRKGSQSFS